MMNILCGKCGSIDIRKNGKTKTGARKYHRKTCGFHGTLTTMEEKQKEKERVIGKPLCGRISQRGIARMVGVSRNRVISPMKKRNTVCHIRCGNGKTSDCRNGWNMVFCRFGRTGDMDLAGYRPSYTADYRFGFRGSFRCDMP